MSDRHEDVVKPSLIRSEEELRVRHEEVEAGAIRVRKLVDVDQVEELVPRRLQTGAVERVAAGDGDSGEIETLPDGSISIPVFEEELLITKRVVVRERVIVRKETVTEDVPIQTELRRERVEIEHDEAGGPEGREG